MDMNPKPASEEPSTQSTVPSVKPRILVIDDETHVLELLSTFLAHSHYSVLSADSGATAIAAAKSSALDLILMDYLLPDINGLELLDELKKLHPQVPLIVMTGLGEDAEVIAQTTVRGAIDCASKTAPLNSLLDKIRRALASVKP